MITNDGIYLYTKDGWIDITGTNGIINLKQFIGQVSVLPSGVIGQLVLLITDNDPPKLNRWDKFKQKFCRRG